MINVRRHILAGSVVALAATTSPVVAAELIEGGFGLEEPADASTPLEVETLAFSADAANSSPIDFTPRHNAPGFSGSWRDRIEMRVDVDPSFGQRFGFAADIDEARSTAMLVGGALELDDVAVIGGVGRTAIFGGTADVISAGMALGDVSASLSFGETAEEFQIDRDVMMLSTDVAIAPWITLQGDVALTETVDEREPLAIGRIGVKLRF